MNYVLARRLDLLKEVQRLQVSLVKMCMRIFSHLSANFRDYSLIPYSTSIGKGLNNSAISSFYLKFR